MRQNPKRVQFPIDLRQVPIALVAMLLAWGALLIQCTDQPAGTKGTSASLKTIAGDGNAIEHFTAPEQQLQYTRTWLTDPAEKKAALESLIQRFPEAKTVRAEAELDLAYLALGLDYRFADSAACLDAIGKYQHIAAHNSDLPQVCAKAHWYMGWIYADLLNDKRQAIAHYQTIVEQYPDATLSIKPPVPWVGVVLPQAIKRPKAVYEYPTYKWSSIALLEIIRNSDKDDEKLNAFEKLWSHDRASLAMGYAFRALVYDSPALAQKVAARAGVYLRARLFSQPIAEEVRSALASLSSKTGALSEQGARRMQ
jgi:Tetratricopeptide repeat